MVAKIISGKSIRGMLQYNENKVEEKQAKLILSSGFATDIDALSLAQKLQRFENRTMLNAKVKTNALHISLNFDAQDKLSDAKLQQIATAYMERIGFGNQPYLVYKHTDAAHTHVHIATTNIKADGERIDTHNIGRTLSEPARKDLEIEYGLIKAEGRSLSNALGIKAADIEKADYGKTPTKRTITNIVNAVVRTYKFTSLAEMNAVLQQFNVKADRGGEKTEMFHKNGMLYTMINETGEQIGVPIKASSIYGKPTLANLEKIFQQNTERRKPYREPLKESVDKVFQGFAAITEPTFIQEMQKRNINVIFRQSDLGFTYGITFIDNRNKTVFNGSDLGKQYSAKGITERLSTTDKLLVPEKTTYLRKPKQTNYLRPPAPSPVLKGLLDKTRTDDSLGVPRRRKKKRPGTEQDQQQERSL